LPVRDRIVRAAAHGQGLGLEIHAGHGLTTGSVGPIARIPEIRELNIGHALIADAIFVGLPQAIRDMRTAMDEARAGGRGR
ncbi:pyridoxine 5'-phosphate synthase, partial [Methylobacterium sp. WL122]